MTDLETFKAMLYRNNISYEVQVRSNTSQSMKFKRSQFKLLMNSGYQSHCEAEFDANGMLVSTDI